jgi:hypothetical protein
MSTQTGFNSGRSDAGSGKGPANTNNMPTQTRQGYEAGYKAGQTPAGARK